jgi:excisionase family DNA binding protein
MKKQPETVSTIQKRVLLTKEAAAFLAISLPTLYRITKAGELAHVRIGRSVRYRLEDLEQFLNDRSTMEWKDFNPGRKKTGPKPKTVNKET